jgi:hypothetical protein
MKTLMIVLNVVIVCYAVNLLVDYNPMAAAINRVVLEVVTGLI